MSSLSIRRLPREIEKALRQATKVQKTTRTEIVLKALEERFHLGDRECRRRKLKDFFGRMTKDDYASFKKATEDFSKVEKDLWK